MKIYLTLCIMAICTFSFAQNKSQEQLKDSVFTQKLSTYSLHNMMLYPNQEAKNIIKHTDNNYSFEPNNSKSLKVMNVVGSTLKVLVESQGIIIKKPKYFVSDIE